MQTIHLNPRDPVALSVTRATFPGYMGQKFKVHIHDEPGMTLDSCWSGGSRSDYRILRLSTMQRAAVPENGSGFGAHRNAIRAPVPAPDYAVVEHSIFCGTDTGITIHVHRDNAAKMIPAPVEMTWAERVVLTATRSLKSACNGVSRATMAGRDTGITQAEWDAAKAGLMGRGLLMKNGGITPEGRNAAGSGDLGGLRHPDRPGRGW